jgi:hypothetical protein
MKDKAPPTAFRSRADEVREIAKSIYDEKERRILLRFIAEYEKISRTKKA